MSKVEHSVSISTPFTVADIVAFSNELGGLSADREITLTVCLKDSKDLGSEVSFDTAWAKLGVEF